MTTYRWKSHGAEIKGGNVQLIGQRLAELVETHGDRLKPQFIVDEARSKKSPLHTLFTWDDKHAAELYRRVEARKVMQQIQVVIDDDSPAQPMFISVIETISEDEEERAYVTTARVMSDSVLSHQVLQRAYGEMETFRAKYGHFKELARVADSAQLEITSLMKGAEVTAA